MNSLNDPLLFIKGPPVFHLPPSVQMEVPIEALMEATDDVAEEVSDEVSDEVSEEVAEQLERMPIEVPKELLEEVQDESTSIYELRNNMSARSLAIIERLTFLSKPFQRKVYRPLIFHLDDGLYVQGEVDKVDEENVTFFVGTGELLKYPVSRVKKIVWRGTEMK